MVYTRTAIVLFFINFCNVSANCSTAVGTCTDLAKLKNNTSGSCVHPCVNSAFDLVCHKLDLSTITFSLCFARSVPCGKLLYSVMQRAWGWFPGELPQSCLLHHTSYSTSIQSLTLHLMLPDNTLDDAHLAIHACITIAYTSFWTSMR